MDAKDLTAVEEAEAQRIADIVIARARVEAIQIGRLLATRRNSELFGETEFQIRDAVHRIGAVAMESALEERPGSIEKLKTYVYRLIDPMETSQWAVGPRL